MTVTSLGHLSRVQLQHSNPLRSSIDLRHGHRKGRLACLYFRPILNSTVFQRYRTPSPVETPCRAKVTRLTRSVTSSAKKNSFPSRCVCNESSPASGPCQFCDPVNSYSIADNEDGVEDSDDDIQQQPASQVSNDIGSPRVCLNKNCDYPLPQHYPYMNCQSCLTAYRERYRDGKLACKGRCGTRIPRNSRSLFCPSCRKSASPTKKNGNGKARASTATKRCRTYGRCGNELPLFHPYKSCDPCRQKNREYKRALVASKAHKKADNADEVVEEVVEEEDEVEFLDQVEVHAARVCVFVSFVVNMLSDDAYRKSSN